MKEITKQQWMRLHQLGKKSSFKTFTEYCALHKSFGYISPDIEEAITLLSNSEEFADYVLNRRNTKIGDYSGYKIDKRFDKKLLGY